MEKHDQISKMDQVYRRSEITIIAAAGNNKNSGLPGVSKSRTIQPNVQIRHIRIVSSMRYPHDAITTSRWWTRGWTYQEAVLSRRRLVFTEDQIYFECNAMNCFEDFKYRFRNRAQKRRTWSPEAHEAGNIFWKEPIRFL